MRARRHSSFLFAFFVAEKEKVQERGGRGETFLFRKQSSSVVVLFAQGVGRKRSASVSFEVVHVTSRGEHLTRDLNLNTRSQ